MKTMHCFGVLALSIAAIGAGCSDDAGDAPGGGTGAGGVGGSLTGTGGTAGAAGGGAGEGGASGAGGEGGEGGDPLAPFRVIDVNDVKTNPTTYEGAGGWFEFRPNVQKLILAGEEQTEHIAILWYTVADGAVGLHLHSQTESVYVIDGTQTDAKGTYTNGTIYFNPPGSGHQISDSSGFFLLAYAAPPNFTDTDSIEEYTPIQIDTTDPELTAAYDFIGLADGLSNYTIPLDEEGGMTAELIETSSPGAYAFEGNYVLVLEGTCDILGATMGPGMLIVAETIATRTYEISAPTADTCLIIGVSF